MRILVIGSGGREHALCWKIAKSTRCSKLYCAPGNGGIRRIAEVAEIAADNIEALLKFAKEKNIDLTVVGPEVPLVKGIVDIFTKNGLKIFGPTKDLALLEGSKVFAKETMRRFGVPTADFKVFTDFKKASEYVKMKNCPLVIKADGLCAGKGVIVCKTTDESQAALKKMMADKAFGNAADKVIVEDCLIGEEASIIVVSDGKNIVPLASSQDHKRIYDSDRGPNTGGMGAYSPAPIVTEELFKKILDLAVLPIVKGLAKEGKPYKGVLYAGIMLTDKGPYVLEFNARFGDPETQAILPRLKSDIVEMMERAVDGNLGNYKLEWDPRPCVSVVMASGGYPGDYEKGKNISGISESEKLNDVVVFHAGTKLSQRSSDGKDHLITSGGRVLNVTALGQDMAGAIDSCYKAVGLIKFDKMHYRRDIGRKALKAQAKR
ncbi:MAG: phosphoribosylamine--glycine ligase [Candidatus Omnitrophota bacterium]|jgi:phosphoribosylamine--glycine ligase